MSSLTTEQLERIRTGLRHARSRLAAELRVRLHDNGTGVPAGLRRYLSDELDAAEAAEQFADDLAWLGHAAASLRQVDAALSRLAERRYGRCLQCGLPIAAERLLAVPTAERCLACQQQAEQSARPGTLSER